MDAWTRLLRALDEWGSAVEVAPGRIEAAVPGSGRRVVVVMTPEQWSEDVAGVGFGREREAIEYVKDTLLALGPDQSYAVYRDYRLEPSVGPELPEEADLPQGPGDWMVLDREGRVVSRFADWQDEEDGA